MRNALIVFMFLSLLLLLSLLPRLSCLLHEAHRPPQPDGQAAKSNLCHERWTALRCLDQAGLAWFNVMWSDDGIWSSFYKMGCSGLLETSRLGTGAASTTFNSSSSLTTFTHSTLSLLVEIGALRSP